MQHAARPKFLSLWQIRAPVTAVTSILHRISGVLMFLAIPLLVGWLDLSLRGPDGWARAAALADAAAFKLFALLLGWAVVHHLCAGIRFLLIDLGLGLELEHARRAARLVNVLGMVGLVVVGWMVLL